MADPLTVFAIGDIDELGLRGVVLRGTDPEAIREAGRHLHKPVVVVPVEQWKQVVEALEAAEAFADRHWVGMLIPEADEELDALGETARAALSSIQKEGRSDA